MPTDYDKEKWVEIYKKAILELEHAKMTGRIGDVWKARRNDTLPKRNAASSRKCGPKFKKFRSGCVNEGCRTTC